MAQGCVSVNVALIQELCIVCLLCAGLVSLCSTQNIRRSLLVEASIPVEGERQ